MQLAYGWYPFSIIIRTCWKQETHHSASVFCGYHTSS